MQFYVSGAGRRHDEGFVSIFCTVRGRNIIAKSQAQVYDSNCCCGPMQAALIEYVENTVIKKIDSITVNYIEEGEGEAIVLLHGWGANNTLYAGIINVLAQGHRVIALDMPGFGKTSEPPEPWCVDDYVDFVMKFIESFGLVRFSVVVHSFGGRVFFKMNARENLPFTIERAVLIDSAGILPKK